MIGIDRRVSGFSKLGILSLNIKKGDVIVFTFIGGDDTVVEHDMKVIRNIIKKLKGGDGSHGSCK